MQVLLRAAFQLAGLRDQGVSKVAIVVDADADIRADTVTALLRPWRAWLDITSVLVTSTEPREDWLDAVTNGGTKAISVITERPDFGQSLQQAATQRGLSFMGSDFPTAPELTVALFHEMSHHHFELGGLNEWNESPSIHAANLLQHLSIANCITHFPQYAIDDLQALYAKLERPLDALDVGCGPISRLRWGALRGLLHITGVDPLLDVYVILLAHHGLDRLPSIRVDRAIANGAEDIESDIADGSVDFAFCCNALDHVNDPPAVIAQVARALRPNGWFALEFATREGSRQDWQQLHRFDLFLDTDSNQLMCQRQDGQLDPLIPRGVTLVVDRVVMTTDTYTAVVLRHREGVSR
jgi:SAM-dependent methyltransferase